MMNTTAKLFDLTGKRSLITGGAGLLGQTFAEALADMGAEVTLLDSDSIKLEAARLTLASKYPGRVHAYVCDLLNQSDVTRCIDLIAAEGRIDALVNSAAIDDKVVRIEDSAAINDGAFPTYLLQTWRKIIDSNLTTTFLTTQAVCRVMAQQGSGSVVNISSTYAVVAPDQRVYEESGRKQRFFKSPAYPTAKAGIIGFTRSIASYYRDTGIRVNTLIPGGVYNGQDADFVNNYSTRTILGRMANTDDYRGAIVFLCSDASSYMTGASLVIDGGWTAL